jgi:hypothetical protein
MNRRLSGLIQDWQLNGSDPQEAFDWSSGLHNWVDKFPRKAKFLETVLPLQIDRVAVRAICESPNYDIIEKFLAVMVWGYGDRGYGPYRVGVMLSQPHAKKVLSKAFEIAQNGQPKDAYLFLMENRIRILGPSFGTKFLSFCTPREIGAPIYDSFVGLWISKYASKEFQEVSTNPENWNTKTYFAYWDWVKKHAEYFNCYPDEVELVLFRDAERQYSKNSSWTDK